MLAQFHGLRSVSAEELLEAVAGVEGRAEGLVGILGDVAVEALCVSVEFVGGDVAGLEWGFLHVGPGVVVDDLVFALEPFCQGDDVVESADGGVVAGFGEARSDGIEVGLASRSLLEGDDGGR